MLILDSFQVLGGLGMNVLDNFETTFNLVSLFRQRFLQIFLLVEAADPIVEVVAKDPALRFDFQETHCGNGAVQWIAGNAIDDIFFCLHLKSKKDTVRQAGNPHKSVVMEKIKDYITEGLPVIQEQFFV